MCTLDNQHNFTALNIVFLFLSNYRIFSKIDEPLDFIDLIENMRTNTVLNVVSRNDVRFLRKLLFTKLFRFKVIYSMCNTEETQISIFPIYCTL